MKHREGHIAVMRMHSPETQDPEHRMVLVKVEHDHSWGLCSNAQVWQDRAGHQDSALLTSSLVTITPRVAGNSPN